MLAFWHRRCPFYVAVTAGGTEGQPVPFRNCGPASLAVNFLALPVN
jgi:hypothetical protein